MQSNLSLYKKRKIARAVLEGLHGFQYRWPERDNVHNTLDSLAHRADNPLVMLRGHPGVGISSILEAFAAKYESQVILVRPRLYSERVNMIGQVLQAIFPLSEFNAYKRIPNSLIHFGASARRFIVIDDLDVIASQNNMHEVVFDQLIDFTAVSPGFTIILSTRDTKLLVKHASLKYGTSVVVPVLGLISEADVIGVIQRFYHWCNQLYGTDVEVPRLSPFISRAGDIPIDQIIHASETLYCLELFATSSRFAGKGGSTSSTPFRFHSAVDLVDLREFVEWKVFK